jgi:hypothetical protein
MVCALFFFDHSDLGEFLQPDESNWVIQVAIENSNVFSLFAKSSIHRFIFPGNSRNSTFSAWVHSQNEPPDTL